jgi:hypothetical protein
MAATSLIRTAGSSSSDRREPERRGIRAEIREISRIQKSEF